jgi:hypothetical protein
MRELRARSGTAPAMTPAQRLQADVADLARRLCAVLERSQPSQATASEAVAFLRAWAAAAGPPASSPPGTPHPIDRLTTALGLSPFEVDLLGIAGMAEEHEGLSGILRALHPRGEARATAGLAAQVLCEGREERLLLRAALEGGPLVRSGALKLQGDAPFFERSLVTAEGLWSALCDLDAWPQATPPIRAESPSAGLGGWLETPAVRRAVQVLIRGEATILLVTAGHEDVALDRAAVMADAAQVLAVKIALPAGAPVEVERAALLHATARGAVPLLRLAPAEGAGATHFPNLEDFAGPAVLCARVGCGAVRGARPVLAVDAEPLSHAARTRMWASALPRLAEHAPVLAARYALEPALAREVASDLAAVESLESREAGLDDVAQSVRTRSALPLAAGIQLVRPRAGFDDLVLSPDRLAQLQEAVARLVHQGKVLDEWRFLANKSGARGVRVLFSGPPGTGKTLSAEVLAGALGVDLLVVDISRVVSKWIGETEKNLASVFDVAERAQAVLLFDEADALFGKRTEVSDAHDRYANLETAYLLARLERFEGLAVLSTNLRQNIDAAFLRRLEFVVDFEEPGQPERETLWRCHVPRGAPVAPDVRFAELAALYPVVGGTIRNAAVAAAFLAASEGSAITRHHLVGALRREYEKCGRTFPGMPAGMAR